MDTHFVYLLENAPVERVKQLTATLVRYGFPTVPDGDGVLKIRTNPTATVTLTTHRERFDAAIDNFGDIIEEFPELPRA